MLISKLIDACTGITLHTMQDDVVVARTIEWAEDALKSEYVVVPRNHDIQSYVPGMTKEGLSFTTQYGFIGLSVESEEFVVEGLNECGLSAGLFYFPHYGMYEPYTDDHKSTCISDLQLVSWILGSFAHVDEVRAALREIHICAVDSRASTVHWRVADLSGQQIVIEVVNGKVLIYDNPIGVLTNSPGFEWHLTNLSNYIHLAPGTSPRKSLGGLTLQSVGAGTNMLGLPGDYTPPSRFVRAAFFQATAPVLSNSRDTVMQAFHILNNFDIPVGVQSDTSGEKPSIPSATQWTAASDLTELKLYYRTMYNSNIRMFDLRQIDFAKIGYQVAPLDEVCEQPVEHIMLK